MPHFVFFFLSFKCTKFFAFLGVNLPKNHRKFTDQIIASSYCGTRKDDEREEDLSVDALIWLQSRLFEGTAENLGLWFVTLAQRAELVSRKTRSKFA